MSVVAVAIDCGWLCCLDDLSIDDLTVALTSLRLLESKRIPLLLDYEGHVLAEYKRNLRPASLGRRFFTTQISRGRFSYQSGFPHGKCREALEKMGFDPSDMPYVGVAQHAGGGMYLTHEEKHLADARIQSVMAACGVTIASLATVTTALS